MTKYLVTPALYYANGPLHLGHLVEGVQVNVFVRALRMAGEDVLYVCGSDAHGTPIEINATKAKKAPEEFAREWQKAHEKSFERFGITYDGGFGTTHSPDNERHAQLIFEHLKKAGHITTRDVEQLFDPQANRFLPDRLVRGTCPKCKSVDQYGDSCEVCGTTYRPTDLIEPKSALTGATPILRTSKHYFFELQQYAEQLKKWTSSGAVPADVGNYLKRWFEDGLKDWDISRDGPYFGFKIPGETDKYFYVWLDAPVGYISLSEHAAKLRGRTFEDYWLSKDTRIIHFIGKDIVYFHTLFWPAMLMASGYTLPAQIAVHGMLTINGEKMSKSRGTFILADRFAEFLNPESLRYYFACKLTDRLEDIDLSFDDFAARVNADLVNKIVNLLSRTVPMVHRFFGGKISEMDETATQLVEEVKKLAAQAEGKYKKLDTAGVCRDVVAIAEMANRYLQEKAPWDTTKTNPQLAHKQLTTALWVGKVCIGLLKPILPDVAEKTEKMLQLQEPMLFSNVMNLLSEGGLINAYDRLFERVEMDKVNEMNGAAEMQTTPTPAISIDEFMKVELRAAKVLEAKDVEGADKLISLTLDVGPFGKKHVFTGLKPHVQPTELVGKTVALVFNLAPRKMKFGVSEGMILASGEDNPQPLILDKANPGDRIR